MEKKTRTCWLGVLIPFQLPHYGGVLLRRDVVAGLTVATVAVPQAMAYALLGGVSPVHGLYTAIVMTTLGSLFGSSAYLINGPTNAISLVVFGVVAGVAAEPDDPNRIGLVALLAVLAGLIQIALSLMKLGRLVRRVPEAVLLGFMAGAGFLVALTEVPTVLGLQEADTGKHHFWYRLWLMYTGGTPPDVWSPVICLSTVGMIAGLHQLNRRRRVKLPEMLLSLVLVSSLVGLLDLTLHTPASLPHGGKRGEGKVGWLHVEGGLPTPRLPGLPADWLAQLPRIGEGALAIALVGLVEALAMARSLSAHSGQPLDYNRQCLAEGLANLGGGLFQCLPGSGSLSRSAINYHSGAATRLSGVFSAAAVAAALWLFAPLAGSIPPPALAGVLLWTAWRIIDPRRLWDCLRSSRADAAILLSTAFVAVFVGIEFAILAGISASVLCRALRQEPVAVPAVPVPPNCFPSRTAGQGSGSEEGRGAQQRRSSLDFARHPKGGVDEKELVSPGVGVARGSRRPKSRPSIVLVHGGFADGTEWQQVLRLLRQDGYTATAVENPLTSLADDIATTRRVLEAQPGPVVVVGHSYGGAVITGAAAGCVRVKALVYVAAFAPAAGERLGALATRFGEAPLGAALTRDEAGRVWIDRARFYEVIARDVSAEEARVLADGQRPMAAAIPEQSVEWAAWKTIPSWYLVTLDDQAIKPELQRFMAQRIGATTSEIRASHVPFLSCPREVARFIEEAAAASDHENLHKVDDLRAEADRLDRLASADRIANSQKENPTPHRLPPAQA
jgi:SulP family sulfate permease